jgi:hypothetical protein
LYVEWDARAHPLTLTNACKQLGGVNVTVYALAAFASYVMIERVGRRKMFLLGSAGQALSMFIIMVSVVGSSFRGPKLKPFASPRAA